MRLSLGIEVNAVPGPFCEKLIVTPLEQLFVPPQLRLKSPYMLPNEMGSQERGTETFDRPVPKVQTAEKNLPG